MCSSSKISSCMFMYKRGSDMSKIMLMSGKKLEEYDRHVEMWSG